jgi:hypothetical protein
MRSDSHIDSRLTSRESLAHGLKFHSNARIDLDRVAGQLCSMGHSAILFPHPKNPVGTAQFLLARAAQARRIALTLSKQDCEIAEAYALECESEARRLLTRRTPSIAA